MARKDFELELGTQIAKWQSSRNGVCLMKFIPRRRHINFQMRMSGLVWSIEALPLPDSTDYTFNIIEVKRSKSPLHLFEAMAADLAAKFKLLLVALEMSIKSVFRAEELLDKLYACSTLFYRAEKDKRWWIIVDAKITAVACKTAREATQQAAQAAAALLVELMESLHCFSQQNIITDELWASSFSAIERWNGIERAVDGGDILQWCNIQILESDGMIPCFEFEVAVQDFLQGNDVISRIGIVNSHAVKVTVVLEEEGWVVCSQEGVETETSLGLDSLLPYLIRNYITTALERNEGKHNIVQGLLQHVIGYLTFVPRVCVVCGSHRLLQGSSTCSNICGSHRLLEDSLSNTCSNICEARKDICRNALPLTWTNHDLWRTEQSGTNSLSNGLSTLVLTDEKEKGWTPHKETMVRAGHGAAR